MTNFGPRRNSGGPRAVVEDETLWTGLSCPHVPSSRITAGPALDRRRPFVAQSVRANARFAMLQKSKPPSDGAAGG